MKLRLAIWTGVGALVAILWTLCIPAMSTTPFVRALVYLSCPIALAGHHAFSFYFALLANAATYALVGLVVENMRRNYKPA